MKASTLLSITLAFALVATAAFAGGGSDSDDSASVAEKEMVRDPTTGKMILAPRYGGTFSFAAVGTPPSADVWFTHHSYEAINGVNETLALGDWGLDRNVFAFNSDVIPVSAMRGLLAESWTLPDDLTVVFTIRDNVFWHDQPPVNGRNLTAHDIAYNWNRYFGLDQFADQGISPALGGTREGMFASFTATDDRTVVFKLVQPRLDPVSDILNMISRAIYAPEVIDRYGDAQDWQTNVGTGPYELVEWVEDSTLLWRRVDNYWGFDEKFPENRLPYFDEVRSIVIKEPAARIAAIRSRQVDHLGIAGGTMINDIGQVNRLRESNPELQFKCRRTGSRLEKGRILGRKMPNSMGLSGTWCRGAWSGRTLG